MKTYKKLMFVFLVALMMAPPAIAGNKKGTFFGWWPGHDEWAVMKKYTAYLNNGKDPQNTQWAEKDWYVQDWLAQYEDSFRMIDGFYKGNILKEQTVTKQGVPVIIVGPAFYRLSGYDKRRVITTVDTVYGITEQPQYPVILLRDWYTKREIGVFGKDGLQIQ